MERGKYIGLCFCGKVGRLTKHHWKPIEKKQTHRQCLMICRDCHDKLHNDFTNDELFKMTLEEQINYLTI